MTESLASIVEQNGASTEQLSRSVQSVAQSGKRISEAADAAATSATQLRAHEPVGGALAKDADEATRRAEPRRGGGRRQHSAIDSGLRPRPRIGGAVDDGDPRDGQAGEQHQRHRRHHQPDCGAHQPAVAQRLDRSGARRRRGPRLRRRGGGDPQPGRPVCQGDGRHRGHHQGAAVGRAGSRVVVERRPARDRREQRPGGGRCERPAEDPLEA